MSALPLPEQAPKPRPNPHAKHMLDLQAYLGLIPETVDKGKSAANLTDDVVFLSIDLEAYEFAQDKITEIGIAVLDTQDIIGTDPGNLAASWLAQIKTRHLRIQEYKHLVNKRWITGCPDGFNFGRSEYIRLNQAQSILTGIFNNPAGIEAPVGRRKIVLVGHGLGNDTDYLKRLKFDPHASGNIVGNMDTQVLAGSTKKAQVGLEKVLRGLGADPVNLHNAGNDAAYALQALVMMAVHHTGQPGAYIEAISKTVIPETHKQKMRKEAKAYQKAKLEAAKENAAKAALAGEIELPQSPEPLQALDLNGGTHATTEHIQQEGSAMPAPRHSLPRDTHRERRAMAWKSKWAEPSNLRNKTNRAKMQQNSDPQASTHVTKQHSGRRANPITVQRDQKSSASLNVQHNLAPVEYLDVGGNKQAAREHVQSRQTDVPAHVRDPPAPSRRDRKRVKVKQDQQTSTEVTHRGP